MKRLIIALCGLGIAVSYIAFRLVSAIHAADYPVTALVTEVIDGDTIKLKSGQLLRYIGIDTPELKRRQKDTWIDAQEQLAVEAKSRNEKLVLGKTISIEYDTDKKDAYGRLLGYAFTESTFVNEQLLNEGLAFFLYFPPNIMHAGRLRQAVQYAADNKIGLWKIAAENMRTAHDPAIPIGTLVTITGMIQEVTRTDRVTYLNFGTDYTTDVTGIIFKRSYPLFDGYPPVKLLKRKRVHIIGMVKEYNGPEIIINSPEQLFIINK